MAVRPINASRFAEILEQWKKDCLQDNDQQSADVISDVILQLDDMPTLTPPPASHDLISRSALLRGETEPEITTGSDSELAEQFEWRRWMDKIKRAPAVGKEE